MRFVEISGIERPISAVGLGTTSSIFTAGGDDRVAPLIEAFLDAGGNCIDTAHIYGLGESEKALGRWLGESGRRDEIFLITKGCHPVVDGDDPFARPWVPRVTPEAVRDDLSESLERLGTDHVDMYLLHRDDESMEPGSLLETLNEEKEAGRIGSFGASNWTVERIAKANAYAEEHGLGGFVLSSLGLSLARPVAMHFPGTLFAGDDTRKWHTDHQFPLLAWSTLAAGFASGRFRSDDPSVDPVTRVYFSDDNFERLRRADEVGRAKGASGIQVALSFVLGQPFPVIALVGPSKVENLREAVAALEVELTSEEMRYLDLEI